MEKNSKIYVCGHQGMVGSAIMRKLKEDGYYNIIARASDDLDLTSQQNVCDFFNREMPDYVFLAAAFVGGIRKHIENPVEMLQKNLEIQNNVISSAYKTHVKKLIFIGSSCIYPNHCKQPIKEEYIMSGAFATSNEGYAIAKLAGLKLCEYYNKQYKTDFVTVVPCNLYGINDHYGDNGHVMSSLIQRFYEAKTNCLTSVVVWGTGDQRREFLYVDDMVDAVLLLMKGSNKIEFINLGYGLDISIKELANLVADIIGYKGNISFDASKPNGISYRLLDISKITALNWKPSTSLYEGIKLTLQDYINRFEKSSYKVVIKDKFSEMSIESNM